MKSRRRTTRVTATARVVRRIKDGDTSMSTIRKRIVVNYLRDNSCFINRWGVSELLKIHDSNASRLLAELVCEGLIVRSSECGYYQLTDVAEKGS